MICVRDSGGWNGEFDGYDTHSTLLRSRSQKCVIIIAKTYCFIIEFKTKSIYVFYGVKIQHIIPKDARYGRTDKYCSIKIQQKRER